VIRRLRYYIATIPAILGILLIQLATRVAEPIDRYVFREIMR
jgi:hypothetical protein